MGGLTMIKAKIWWQYANQSKLRRHPRVPPRGRTSGVLKHASRRERTAFHRRRGETRRNSAVKQNLTDEEQLTKEPSSRLFKSHTGSMFPEELIAYNRSHHVDLPARKTVTFNDRWKLEDEPAHEEERKR
ncbi:hypothetical protein YC2023_056456 [Brassica napus]